MKTLALLVCLVAYVTCTDTMAKEQPKLTLPTQFNMDDTDNAPKFEIVIKDQFENDILVRIASKITKYR